MSKIERGFFSDLLRRYLGMTGSSSVAEELAPEISPILVLESERPEWEFLKSNRAMSASFHQNPNVALPTSHRLRNPATSGVVAVVFFMSYSHLNLPSARISITRNTEAGDLASITPTVARDTRYPAVNASALIASAGNVALTGDTFYSNRSLANTVVDVPIPFVLTPGFQLQMSTIENDVDLTGSWQWLEKRIDQLELR